MASGRRDDLPDRTQACTPPEWPAARTRPDPSSRADCQAASKVLIVLEGDKERLPAKTKDCASASQPCPPPCPQPYPQPVDLVKTSSP
eukprot:scaffold118310_cov66-Phaeocystis_antarctica.AAC.4